MGNEAKQYFFPLDEWRGNNVHDSKGEIAGVVENPIWLINESFFWKPVYSQSFQDVAGLNYNPLRQNLFIFTRDSLITYSPEQKKVSAEAYADRLPVKMVLGKSIFNAPRTSSISTNCFDVPRDTPSIASLEMDSGRLKWTVIGKDVLSGQLHHHNVFYDAQQEKFYLFGGYGLYSYHNAFLRLTTTAPDTWEKVASSAGDTICPRFFAATGPVGQDRA